MSMRCEDVRPLLAELVYEEVDPELADRLREHLGTCLSCRRHQMAFLAVRRDLGEWKPAENASRTGITFIAPGAHARTPIWQSRLFQGLSVAASFVLGVFLTAAFVNLQVQSGPDGWALSTSFSDQTLGIGAPASEKPDLVPVEKIHKLDSWLDNQLDTRGVVHVAGLPSHEELTPMQMQSIDRRFSEIAVESFNRAIAEVIEERDAQHERDLRNLVEVSLDEHSEEVGLMLINLVDQLEARRDDAVLGLMTSLYDTVRKVEEANGRIDTLDSLVTQVTAPVEHRSPEH